MAVWAAVANGVWHGMPAVLAETNDYQLFQSILVDPAGEQREDFPKFIAACDMLGVRPIYGDPTRKSSMALAEIRVQIHALGMKRIMLSNSLLLEHWPLRSTTDGSPPGSAS